MSEYRGKDLVDALNADAPAGKVLNGALAAAIIAHGNSFSSSPGSGVQVPTCPRCATLEAEWLQSQRHISDCHERINTLEAENAQLRRELEAAKGAVHDATTSERGKTWKQLYDELRAKIDAVLAAGKGGG